MEDLRDQGLEIVEVCVFELYDLIVEIFGFLVLLELFQEGR